MSSVAPTQIEVSKDTEKKPDPMQEADNVNEVTTASSNAEGAPKQNIEPEQNLLESESMGELLGDSLRDKSQSLIDIANCTFRELCITLENEQTKLRELEAKRIKLHEEMQRLKVEIEEEKNIYNFHLSGKYKEKAKVEKDDLEATDNKEEQVEGQSEMTVDETLETIVESTNTDDEIESSMESRESTFDYVKRQRHRLELINQGIPLSEISEDDAISTVGPTDDESNDQLTDDIIDQCIPSNLSVLQQNQSLAKGRTTPRN